MASNQENFNENSSVPFNQNINLEGIDSFKKNLEKHFFATVTIRNCSSEITSVKLVLELECNFSLSEILNYYAKDSWGNFKSNTHSFTGLLRQLKNDNDLYIEVEEISIFLKDTALIINRIYDQSVPDQLKDIFNKISDHYLFFTKGLYEIPYEIHIPVFEDKVMENDSTLMNIKSGNTNKQDYYSFWGLYFYCNDDAIIYDLQSRIHISGHLEMLNR